jgi:hypothetical protein
MAPPAGQPPKLLLANLSHTPPPPGPMRRLRPGSSRCRRPGLLRLQLPRIPSTAAAAAERSTATAAPPAHGLTSGSSRSGWWRARCARPCLPRRRLSATATKLLLPLDLHASVMDPHDACEVAPQMPQANLALCPSDLSSPLVRVSADVCVEDLSSLMSGRARPRPKLVSMSCRNQLCSAVHMNCENKCRYRYTTKRSAGVQKKVGNF